MALSVHSDSTVAGQPVAFRCVVHGDALEQRGDEMVGVVHGLRYPIIDGIPILIADADQRKLIVDAVSHPQDASHSAATFYNRVDEMNRYLSPELPIDRAFLADLLPKIGIAGPVLEIGSGRGELQGTGGDYFALDYSLAALLKWVSPAHPRVCASADRLPFPDHSFRLVFTVNCLEHVPDAGRAFQEIDRVLKPGGYAYLAPAWHCVQYVCDGVPVRPYHDLSLYNKWVKATLALRKSRAIRAIDSLPSRLLRRLSWTIRRRPTTFRFTRLRADYSTFWMSDSDACARIDSHEACLFFKSRGYDVLRPGNGTIKQLMVGAGAMIVGKPM